MTPEERKQKASEWSQTTVAPASLIEDWLRRTDDNLEIVKLAVKNHVPGLLHGDWTIMLYLEGQGEAE